MPLELGGYTAYVRCEGKELEQYDVQLENETTATCYIASETGKEFTVRWGDRSSSSVMSVSLYIDGRLMVNRAHDAVPESTFKYVTERPGEIRSVHFAPLVLTDDDDIASSMDVSPRLGMIEVEMRRVASFTEGQNLYAGVGNVSEIGPVHEKSKKAGVHAVSLGECQNIQPRETVIAHGLEKEPFAVFKFRYRPIELLRANGIAPSPHLGVKRSLNGVETDDHGADSKKSRVERAAKEAEVKEDQESGDDEDGVTFLEEQIAMMQNRLAAKKAKKQRKAIRVPSAGSNEVIDLT